MPIGAFSHNHEQTDPSDTWIISHNLGTLAPIIDVYVDIDGVKQKIIPASVQVVDNITAKVTFSSPRTGIAAVR